MDVENLVLQKNIFILFIFILFFILFYFMKET
jgi:hypothetical protein